MKRFVDGVDRPQALLLPDRLEDYVHQDNPVQLRDKLAKVREQMAAPDRIEQELQEAPDSQISLTDPDARSMTFTGRATGTVGCNLQAVVDADHHLIVAHEVTNIGA